MLPLGRNALSVVEVLKMIPDRYSYAEPLQEFGEFVTLDQRLSKINLIKGK